MSPPFDELWTDYLEGDLNEGGFAELNELLATDADLMQRAADLYEEHRLLGVALRPFDRDRFVEDVQAAIASDREQFVSDVASAVGIRPAKDTVAGLCEPGTDEKQPASQRPATGRRLGSAAGLVAIVALSVLVSALLWRGDNEGTTPTEPRSTAADNPRNVPSARPVATLLLAEECLWSTHATLDEGQRLTAESLKLKSGLAVIRFDGGAEVVMTGETSLTLVTSERAELQYGDVVVRADDGAEGFELTTPASPIVDLGTEFAVRVDRSGTTEVHVLDGIVEYNKGDTPNVLPAGKAVRLTSNTAAVEEVEFDSPRFDEVVQQANPKPQPHRMTVYEGFYYEPGTLPLDQTVKGKGWAGPWRRRLPEERQLPADENSPTSFEIVHGQMNVTWPVPGGRLGMLKLPSVSSYYVRPMKKSIDLDRDGVTFFSLMVRETERPTKQSRPRERVRLTLRSLEDYYSDYISFGHGSGYQPRVRTGDGVLHASPMMMPAEQTTLWIGKIVSRAEGEDEIYFRVYGEQDVLGYAEPATWHVVTRGVELDSHLDCVLLSSEGKTSRIVDELRIGPTWRSVAPMREK